MEENGEGYALVVRNKDTKATSCDNSSSLNELLEEYKDVFPDDLSKGLTPNRDIKHAIDLIQEHVYQIEPLIDANRMKIKSLRGK